MCPAHLFLEFFYLITSLFQITLLFKIQMLLFCLWNKKDFFYFYLFEFLILPKRTYVWMFGLPLSLFGAWQPQVTLNYLSTSCVMI